MKHSVHILSVFFLSIALTIDGAISHVSPYFSIRPQGENAARELVGWTNHINLFGVNNFYATGALTTEYTKSFNSQRIAQCLFGDDLLGDDSDCHSIKVSGSGVANRNSETDWLADYFGLPRDFQSTLNFYPRIENFIADFNFYLGLDNITEGLFFRMNIPITYTKWKLNFSECLNDSGSANHHPGYFNGRVTLGPKETSDGMDSYNNAYGVVRQDLLADFTSYISDGAVPNLGSTLQTILLPAAGNTLEPFEFPPIFFDPLRKARFVSDACSDTTTVGVADLQFILGWNAFQNDNYHVGFGLRVTTPTGNAPKGETVFEPILGNGNHWGLGVHFTSHARLWHSEDEFNSIALFMDVNVTHLFNTKQVRTFDLKEKTNSRYMLAQKMTRDVENALTAGSTIPGPDPVIVNQPIAIFAHQFTPLANLTTIPVDVSVGIQADLVFMFTYQRGNVTWDLGYNLWIRSCEKISLDCTCPTPFSDGKTWALKGDSQVYGYADPTQGNAGGAPLSASQSSANIHVGENGYTGLDTTTGSLSLRPTRNPGIDHTQYALNANVTTQVINDNPNFNGPRAGLQTQTSVNPVFINECNLDLDGARTKSLSHKIFTHVSYTWVEHTEHWDPYLGIGTEGEFNTVNKDCEIDCSSKVVIIDPCKKICRRCGLSQWGVWVKGGISFG